MSNNLKTYQYELFDTEHSNLIKKLLVLLFSAILIPGIMGVVLTGGIIIHAILTTILVFLFDYTIGFGKRIGVWCTVEKMNRYYLINKIDGFYYIKDLSTQLYLEFGNNGNFSFHCNHKKANNFDTFDEAYFFLQKQNMIYYG